MSAPMKDYLLAAEDHMQGMVSQFKAMKNAKRK